MNIRKTFNPSPSTLRFFIKAVSSLSPLQSLKSFSLVFGDGDRCSLFVARIAPGRSNYNSTRKLENSRSTFSAFRADHFSSAVRYARASTPQANLYNREGLPVTPFWTDDWDAASPRAAGSKAAEPPPQRTTP